MNKKRTTKMLIVGAGGIGSQLLDLLIPALTAGDMAERIGGIQVHIMDDDRVEVSNLVHQRHEPRMVGRLKVDSLAERLAPHMSQSLSLTPIPEKLRDVTQLEGYDLVVVAVDRPAARALVHAHVEQWLDLRCSGDGYMAMDYELDPELVVHMTPLDQVPASCQYPGAVETGNVQFGYVIAAAHGAQWLIQKMRAHIGEPTRPTPARMFSLTYGELGFPEIRVLKIRGDE
tara:strand:- start:5425 stop:6114 length:690 start_codon:yes stop_codon:yes gene_type:complete